MKASEFVTEVDASYFQRLGYKLGGMSLDDALTVGNRDSNLRQKAENFINLLINKMKDLKAKPSQKTTQAWLKQIAYGEMNVQPNPKSEKAIQELVDLADNDLIDTNTAKTYMTQLVTMSLMQPQQQRSQPVYGDYLPMDMMQTGSIVPVKYIQMKNNNRFVKFNGDWYRDVDPSEHQIKLHRNPAVNSYSKLESMTGFDLPMRVGSGRTLERLSQAEMDQWYSTHE